MDTHPFRIVPAGDSGLLLQPAGRTFVDLTALAQMARQALEPFGPVDVITGYEAVLVRYDPLTISVDRAMSTLAGVTASSPAGRSRQFRVPVLYGGDHGPDLPELAALHGMSEREVVDRHAAATYRVRCIGFSPGFPYLDGLDPALSTPRLATPRVRVPAGSVAIGGEQTGVYPTASPGGWRVIGCTPVVLFDAHHDPPVVYGVGDTLRFDSIDGDEFEQLRRSSAWPERLA